MHFLYAPIDLLVVPCGLDIRYLCGISLFSFDWNVTHIPSQSGSWSPAFGIKSFATRERGICAGLSTPRQTLWSLTNCSLVTISFSQLRIVALSMFPLFGLLQEQRIR
jgi:hypothetical protein